MKEEIRGQYRTRRNRMRRKMKSKCAKEKAAKKVDRGESQKKTTVNKEEDVRKICNRRG